MFLLSRTALAAENLFLRRQLALFQERKAKPRRVTATGRLVLIALAQFFDWHDALVVVKPRRLSGGIALHFDCSGAGNRGSAVGLHCRQTSGA